MLNKSTDYTPDEYETYQDLLQETDAIFHPNQVHKDENSKNIPLSPHMLEYNNIKSCLSVYVIQEQPSRD